MSDVLILVHTAIAVALIIALITVVRITPAVVLIIGSIYLGVATGLGFKHTMDTVATGFGDLMGEVGIIIGFGVLLGSLLSACGAIERIIQALLKVVGRKGSPYALSLSTTVIFPAIYFDVALVMLGSLARSMALRTGMSIAALGGALAAGLEAGLLFVPPGVAALALSGTLHLSLGTMLVYGLAVGIPSAALTTFLYGWLATHGIWNSDKDEAEFKEDRQAAEHPAEPDAMGMARQAVGTADNGDSREPVRKRDPSLGASLLPIVIPLGLIVIATVTETAGLHVSVIAFFGNSTVALLIGLLAAYLLAVRVLTYAQIEEAIAGGLKTSGLILLFTGVAGSLGGVISETGIQHIVSGAFSATALSPLLLVWLVAALLRVAQGSATVAAIAAAGIVAPIMADLGVAPILVALASGSGAAFGAHVSDNSFWLYHALLGTSVRGTFKSYSVCQAMVAVISLVITLGLSAVI